MPHSQHAAQVILAPHMDQLSRLFPAAWDRWEDYGEQLPASRLQASKRTRASMLHDFAAHEAGVAFDGSAPSVVLTERPGFLLMSFESVLAVRLKKFKGASSFETCGIETDQRQLFEAQEPLLGFPQSTNLVLGYRLDDDETAIASTSISCSTKGHVHWTLEVPLGGGGTVVDHPTAAPNGPVEPDLRSTLHEADQDAGGGLGAS